MRISDWSSDVCSSDLHQPDSPHNQRSGEQGENQYPRDSRFDQQPQIFVVRAVDIIDANLIERLARSIGGHEAAEAAAPREILPDERPAIVPDFAAAIFGHIDRKSVV